MFNSPPFLSREAKKALRGKRELWAVIQDNARHTRDVAKAVDARDLREVKRIVDRAKLSRHDFLSACDRLGFLSADEARRRANESDYGGVKNGVDIGPESPYAVPGTSTNRTKESMELQAEAASMTTMSGGAGIAGGDNPFAASNDRPSATVEDGALLLGAVPVFFLDAEGRGGTTALALATIENDAEMVRRLVKEVSGDVRFTERAVSNHGTQSDDCVKSATAFWVAQRTLRRSRRLRRVARSKQTR